MNPFQLHDENMEAYQEMLSEPVNKKLGNYIVYGGTTYPAVVGVFTVRQVLVAGGFSPRLIAEVIVRKCVLPGDVNFKTSQLITAAQIGGSVRQCIIDAIEDTFTEYRLTLWDKNQNA